MTPITTGLAPTPNRKDDMMNVKTQAAASDGTTAVLVGEFGGKPALIRYAGDWKRRDAMDALIARAAAKIGWKRDRRCKCGFRRIAA